MKLPFKQKRACRITLLNHCNGARIFPNMSAGKVITLVAAFGRSQRLEIGTQPSAFSLAQFFLV